MKIITKQPYFTHYFGSFFSQQKA
ncbi:hypothetical protein [Scytonema sp. NUACC21]